MKGLEIEQNIEVYRSGDTIPIVLGPSLTVDIRQKTFSSFEHLKGVCPCCGHSIALTVLEEPTDSTIRPRNYSCLNSGCPDRVAAALTYFAGKFNMDICGLGEATAKQLVRDFKLRNPIEIYDLTHNDLYPKGVLKTKNKKKYPQKLFDYIQGSKTKPLWCFLKSIGIPEVGDSTARSLAERFKTFDALLDASEEELAYTEGVGSVTAKYITRFFAGPVNRSIWREKVAKLNLT